MHEGGPGSSCCFSKHLLFCAAWHAACSTQLAALVIVQPISSHGNFITYRLFICDNLATILP